jgi:hypothetical protein
MTSVSYSKDDFAFLPHGDMTDEQVGYVIEIKSVRKI